MKLTQITAAPPDLWAIFAEMEKGPDGELRPASAVESVQRVVCLALTDDQKDSDDAPLDLVNVLIDDEHGQFWLAEESGSFVGVVFAANEQEARLKGELRAASVAAMVRGEHDHSREPAPTSRRIH
jgi:hypothetical protein